MAEWALWLMLGLVLLGAWVWLLVQALRPHVPPMLDTTQRRKEAIRARTRLGRRLRRWRRSGRG